MPAPPPFLLPTGAIESPPDSRDYPAAMRLGNAMAAAPLPSADRLGWMPPVLTQTMGSCVVMSQSQVAAIHERGESGGSAVLNDESWYPEVWAEQNPGVPFQDTGLMSRPAQSGASTTSRAGDVASNTTYRGRGVPGLERPTISSV